MDKCPFCGARSQGQTKVPYFECETYEAHSTYGGKLEPYWHRSTRCMESQLAAQEQEITALRERLRVAEGLARIISTDAMPERMRDLAQAFLAEKDNKNG